VPPAAGGVRCQLGSDLQLREAQLGAGRRHPRVARHRRLAAAAQRHALHRGAISFLGPRNIAAMRNARVGPGLPRKAR